MNLPNLPRSIALAFCMAIATAMVPALAQDDPAVATASAVLDRMEAGDFEGATADFNAGMKAKLDAIQLAGVQTQLESAGAVQSRDPAQVTQDSGFHIVRIRIHRAQAAIDATVSIDGEGKVAGLFFAPAGATP